MKIFQEDSLQEDFIDIKEPTPQLNSFKCKAISYLISFALKKFTFIISLYSWYIYDYFIAICVLILSFIIMGIIRSKLRNSVIPIKQREFQYDDKSIADWYTAKVLCF